LVASWFAPKVSNRLFGGGHGRHGVVSTQDDSSEIVDENNRTHRGDELEIFSADVREEFIMLKKNLNTSK